MVYIIYYTVIRGHFNEWIRCGNAESLFSAGLRIQPGNDVDTLQGEIGVKHP
jgi:hypothetical protein